jgi:hypothetical protein
LVGNPRFCRIIILNSLIKEVKIMAKKDPEKDQENPPVEPPEKSATEPEKPPEEPTKGGKEDWEKTADKILAGMKAIFQDQPDPEKKKPVEEVPVPPKPQEEEHQEEPPQQSRAKKFLDWLA